MLTITALGFGGTSLLANLKFALNIQNLISKRTEGNSVGSTDLGEIIDISLRKLAHSKNDSRNGIF